MNEINYRHKNLAGGKWLTISFFEQMANIGSEIERAINWRKKNNKYSEMASDRALELLDLTIADPKNKKRLKELMRLREVMADYFYFNNIYESNDKLWRNYFFPFSYAARINN